MVRLKQTESTIEDLMALPQGSRAELIDGVIYMMSPALARHSLVTGVLTSNLSVYFKEKRKKDPNNGDNDSWLIIPEAWIYYDHHNSFVHDIAGYPEKELPQLPSFGPIKVRPAWVCEVLSPSNWSNDTRRKRLILQEHRVPYYWLVDPDRKTIQVFEMYANADKYQFTHSVEYSDGVVRLAPFLDLELDLMEIFRK